MLPHEMRTPLNGILGFGELLQSAADSLPPEEVADMGRAIYESGRRLERLIENFLVYVQLEITAGDPARAGELRGKTIAAAHVISDQATAVATQCGRVTDLKLQLDASPVSISQDYLGKLTVELVLNACKFSKQGTPITVALSGSSTGVIISINDQGRGLTSDQIARIGAYMQFDRKSQEQQGAGLGLIIAKRIAELHGGSLSITSDATQGTTVTVKLLPAG
jgi:two-component system sensor histidine kinase/response regulator